VSRMPRTAAVSQQDGVLIVEIAGPPYERGRQHGIALADRVRHLRQRLVRDIIYGKGWAMGTGFMGVLYGILAKMHPYIPRELREEMRGVADGARVPYRDILLLNCFDDVLHTLIQLNPVLAPILHHRFVKPVLGWLGAPPTPAADFACSAFVLTSERTSIGRPLHGRNLDYLINDGFVDPEGLVPDELRQNVIVFIVRPDRGRAFASVAWSGFVGAVTTVNDAGLSLACLTSTVSRETANGTPLLFLYRLIAQNAATLDEAEWIMRGTRRTIGNNVTMASGPADDARCFEFTMERVTATTPADGLVLATNHFQHPSMRPLQTGWVASNSEYRLARLNELFAEGRFGVADAQAALADTCPATGAVDVWDCLHNPGTVYSTVADPARCTLWVRAYDRLDRPWVELDLSEPLRAAA
jgi:isopenicillin-N N-acyltransferase like protein